VLRILCSAESRFIGEEEELLLEVFLDLYTTSLAWSQALDLGLGEQQPAPGATRSTSSTLSDGAITKPLLAWQVGRLFDSITSDDKLLGEIWSSLGFTTAMHGHIVGDDDGKENAAGIEWDSADVKRVLLAGLGYAWPFQCGIRGPSHVTKWLRQAERFLQRVPRVRVFVCVRACVHVIGATRVWC